MKRLADEDALLAGMYWIEDAGACSGVYVLEEGRTLIDSGNMFGLIDELQDLGSPDRLQRILLTHSHFDHVGGMAEIYQATNPDIYVHRLAREYLRLHRPPFPEFFEALEKDGKIHMLEDGDSIGGDHPLRVMHTPGHTAGDLCFFHDASGALFCGDAVLPHRFQHAATLSKPDEVCGGRMRDKLASLRKLLALPVRHLFSGHGEPVFHKGADQIKLSLFTLYQSLQEDHPERAWVAMGQDMVALGQHGEARQCVMKALQLNARDAAAMALQDLLERSANNSDPNHQA
jgi:glyoxylase-like metal-dependent hydrolase (beta-lactamase superfamily II)